LIAVPLVRACYFEGDFLCSAQRRLTASAMRLRPSGVKFRFFFAVFFAGAAALAFRVVAPRPPSNARARCSWAISRSICANISETPTAPPYSQGSQLVADLRVSNNETVPDEPPICEKQYATADAFTNKKHIELPIQFFVTPKVRIYLTAHNLSKHQHFKSQNSQERTPESAITRMIDECRQIDG
jgi:hypothetical protein